VIYTFGGYRLDSIRFEIARGDRTLAVEPQVLELLIVLIDNRDHVVSRDELLEKIWKGRIVSDTTLSSRIKSARRLIGDNGRRQDYIRTIHGRGFRFVGPVEVEAAEPAEPTPEPPAPRGADRPPTLYARSGDTHIAYHLFGDGPVNLVLTPGFVSHIDNYWDSPAMSRWLTRLGRLARVAMFDKRGTGLSDRVGALPDMDERMDDVRAVMDAAGFETAYIMGISEGGSLAALFSAHHPARCDGLILYGSFAQFKHWFPDEASLQTLFDYIETDWGTGKSLAQFAPTVANDPDFVRWWGQFERLGATPGAAIAIMRMNSRIDISGVLSSIQVPTLVIHVSNDVLIDIEAGKQLAAEIPGAQYVELPGTDHLVCGENADPIIDAVDAFLAQAKRGQSAGRLLATIVLVRVGKDAAGEIDGEAQAIIDAELHRLRATRISLQSGGRAATFDGPARAAECALRISRLLRHRDIVHRIGVHTGEIGLEGAHLEGTAMNIASDVASRAVDGEILVSRTVSDLVAGSGVALKDEGEFFLPSIDQYWHLFRVID